MARAFVRRWVSKFSLPPLRVAVCSLDRILTTAACCFVCLHPLCRCGVYPMPYTVHAGLKRSLSRALWRIASCWRCHSLCTLHAPCTLLALSHLCTPITFDRTCAIYVMSFDRTCAIYVMSIDACSHATQAYESCALGALPWSAKAIVLPAPRCIVVHEIIFAVLLFERQTDPTIVCILCWCVRVCGIRVHWRA